MLSTLLTLLSLLFLDKLSRKQNPQDLKNNAPVFHYNYIASHKLGTVMSMDLKWADN